MSMHVRAPNHDVAHMVSYIFWNGVLKAPLPRPESYRTTIRHVLHARNAAAADGSYTAAPSSLQWRCSSVAAKRFFGVPALSSPGRFFGAKSDSRNPHTTITTVVEGKGAYH